MDKELISRAALGNIASLGHLYDARSDKFCGISIFNKNIPEDAVTITDSHFSDIHLVHSDNFSEKFHKLDVQAELQVSVLGGLFTLNGSGHYLNDQKKSARTVKSSLVYNIKTKDEKVNIYHQDLKDAFAMDAIKSGVATHVVVGISWGANSVLTCSYENKENRNVKEIEGSLSAHMKLMSVSITGKVSVDFKEGENDAGTNFDIRMFGDILPGKDDLPTTTAGALQLMRQMPSLVAASNNGKGKPLTFMLVPLKLLEDYLKFAMKADIVIKSLEEASLQRVVKMFEEMTKVQQQLHDFHQDVMDHQFCVKEEDVAKIFSLKEEMAVQETSFRSKLASTLVLARSGKCDVSQVEELIKEFQSSEYSPEKILSLLATWGSVTEKINFAKHLVKNGVTYIGFKGNLDEEMLKKFMDTSFVLYFTSQSKSDVQRWVKNRQMYFQEIMKKKEGCSYYAVDCDIHPNLLPPNFSSCVQMTKSGMVLTEDLLADQDQESTTPYAHITTGTVKIIHKPNKRVPLCIPCTGNNCNPKQEYTWKCKKCRATFDWGFDDHVYCDCGKTFAQLLEFKCTDKKHGITFERHEEQHLIALLGKLRPFQELNLLLLGETGVGKSTWINAFLNFVNYDTLEEAEKENLLTLIPSNFTVCNEDFEQITVNTGTDKNETQIAGQSATQDARIYQFYVGKTTVNLVDTPGIGDTRGIEQDKKNFENILGTIGHLGELHGICILLKPNNARLNIMFRFCIKELLTYLHRDASKNIIFCFTNSRGTFYRPGDTLPALKALLQENKEVEIAISKETIYCFDSEAYRFLAAVKNKPPVTFPNDEKENFSKSWEKSISETKRMMAHIRALPPHPIQNTLNLNHARDMVLKLTRPLAEIARNIHTNKTIVQEETEELKKTRANIDDLKKKLMTPRTFIEMTSLDYPMTVCSDSSCVRIWTVEGVKTTEYVTVCHDHCALGGCVKRDSIGDPALMGCAAMRNNYCCVGKCNHSYAVHLHIYYKSQQVVRKVEDLSVKESIQQKLSGSEMKQKMLDAKHQLLKEYEHELSVIQQSSVNFAYFLKKNAITPYNDEMQAYLKHLIREEKEKVAAGGSTKTMDSLQKSLLMYNEKKDILEKAMKQGDGKDLVLGPEQIDELVKTLKGLKHSGKELEEALEGISKTAHMMHQSSVFVQPPPPPPSSKKNKPWYKIW